jgi:long-subunit acyl-CoA synthetase (AMP-forming)
MEKCMGNLWHLVKKKTADAPNETAYLAKARGLWRSTTWRTLATEADQARVVFGTAVKAHGAAAIVSDGGPSTIAVVLGLIAADSMIHMLAQDSAPADIVASCEQGGHEFLLVRAGSEVKTGLGSLGWDLVPSVREGAPPWEMYQRMDGDVQGPAAQARRDAARPQALSEQALRQARERFAGIRSEASATLLFGAVDLASVEGLAIALDTPLMRSMTFCFPERGVPVVQSLREICPHTIVAGPEVLNGIYKDFQAASSGAAGFQRGLLGQLTSASSRPRSRPSPESLVRHLVRRKYGLRNCSQVVLSGGAIDGNVLSWWTHMTSHPVAGQGSSAPNGRHTSSTTSIPGA